MRELGTVVAAMLRARLADLRAANTVADVPIVARPTSASTREGEIDLGDGFKMIICANHPVPPVRQSRVINWSQISRIKILRIGA